MSRSLKKGPYIDEKLIAKVKARKKGDKTPIRTWSRSCVIIPEMVGFIFEVHNGKDFIPATIREDMVGHKLGEFSPTTKFTRHGGKMQREQEASRKVKEATK
jgi:small subunit ribosomal protein S19